MIGGDGAWQQKESGWRVAGIDAAAIALLTLLCYFPALDNFFTWDDFLWLYRAKSLTANPGQMFAVDVVYFDPLVYLGFWLNYQLNQLNHFWYHLFDLAIHAANGVLLYLLVLGHSRERRAALASGLLFVSSFAAVDAVVWSSSRPDLLAVFFSLGALLAFQRHLGGAGRRALVLSVLCYVLALGAKGTPVVLPLVLAFMICQESSSRRRFTLLVPYLAVAAIYCTLLLLGLAAAGKPLLGGGGGPGLNFHNLVLAAAGLFFPEIRLAGHDPLPAALLVAGAALLACTGFARPLAGTRRLGAVLMFSGLAPVLILRDFHLASTLGDAGHLLNSPGHRVYLASAGAAILAGTLLAGLASRTPPRRALFFTALALVSLYCFSEVRQRELIWDGSARYIRGSVEGLLPYRPGLADDSLIGLVNFPMSRGFMRPALAIYCGLENVLLLPMESIPAEILDAPEILRYLNRGHFFVYGKNRVHDLSGQLNRLLGISLRYQAAADGREKALLLAEYQDAAREMNAAIALSKAL